MGLQVIISIVTLIITLVTKSHDPPSRVLKTPENRTEKPLRDLGGLEVSAALRSMSFGKMAGSSEGGGLGASGGLRFRVPPFILKLFEFFQAFFLHSRGFRV